MEVYQLITQVEYETNPNVEVYQLISQVEYAAIYTGFGDLKSFIKVKSGLVITDLSTDIQARYRPENPQPLLIRYDHTPSRNEENVKVDKTIQFTIYNPDPLFNIDINTLRVRINSGIWCKYGDSRFTINRINYKEYFVSFKPSDFDYDAEVEIEVYCEDNLNNPGIKLEIL